MCGKEKAVKAGSFMLYVDMHLHTNASDGLLTPAGLVKLAKKKGFTAIAITDHDSTEGIEEAIAEGEKQGVEVIPGIELSTLSGDREMHLLGYFLDYESIEIKGLLFKIINARQNRAFNMIEKLNAMGINIELCHVQEIAGTDFIGRPHIARAMQEKGYIKNIADAFNEKYIGRGGLAYVERFKLSPNEGIKVLLKTKAVPVLAHPGYLSHGPPLEENEIIELVENGLRGIEVYYSKHTQNQEQKYKQIAAKYNLFITGGSDYHGHDGEANCFGSVKLPYNYLQAIKSECKSI